MVIVILSPRPHLLAAGGPHEKAHAAGQPQTQKSPDTPGSPEGNTEGPGTASSEPLLPS